MKKRMRIMIAALSIIFGGIIGFHLFKGFMIKRFFANYEAPPVTVASAKALKKNWQPHIPAVGTFIAINGVDVNSQATGNVVKIHFESGQYIEKEAPLIDIDDSVEQAALKFNEAQLRLKEISYQRQVDLYKRGATPVSNVDEAKANLEQAQANVEKIQAEIRQKHIRAPFAGQLGIRQVNVGQYVTPGQTAIVSLQSLDPLYLEFYLPEQLQNNLHLNQTIFFSVEAFPNFLFRGKITAINSKVDPTNHNLLIQATSPNCPLEAIKDAKKSSSLITLTHLEGESKLLVNCDTDKNTQHHISEFAFLPGMFNAISVEQPSFSEVVVLPSTAISYSLYGNSVFIIEKHKEGKKDQEGRDFLYAKRVFVATGEQEGNYTVIKKGVEAGQLVVSSGELKLQNGARVIINNNVALNTLSNPDKLGQ